MTPMPVAPVALPPFRSDVAPATLRRRTLANVLHAGHCAPTVMRTLLDVGGVEASWLVRLVAGLPGGIGNSGHECGALTASLVVLGLRHARDRAQDGVPVVVSKGRALLRDFQAMHGSCACRDLLVFRRLPLRCAGVVRRAPERCVAIDGRACDDAMSAEERSACARLHAHLVERDFHCAHAVLRHACGASPVQPALLDATSAFLAGTACAGLTCSALTAGVMWIGLARGREKLRPRQVMRGGVGMATGGRVFADDVDALSGAMNGGNELVRWFRARSGSTQCRNIAGADLSSSPGVLRYVESDGVSRCRELARLVAERARRIAGYDPGA